MKKYFAVLILTAAVVSCGPRILYPHLGWLISWYISDYISLDDRQKNMLEERLLKQLDWHCRTQLTIYAATLRAIGRDFTNDNQPIDYSKMQFYDQRLRKLWQKLLLRIAPDVTDILLTASDDQITELFDNLKKRTESLADDFDKLSCDPKDRPNRGSEVWGFRLPSSSLGLRFQLRPHKTTGQVALRATTPQAGFGVLDLKLNHFFLIRPCAS